MSKFKSILIFFTSIIFLQGCSTIKEGFSSQKKGSTDEFLVEKKSPLVMPPDFDELPLPKDQNQTPEKNEQTSIKSLISNNENSSSETINNTNQNTSFENSLLEKIKKN